ncbi:MAG: ATP phosphoribosyltransferase [Fusobacteriia bacterium 4572_132]|nr:MAG: ATP phosphoribosyltransferase [Fusobacteriia bacterium 4572_132]
MKDKITIALPKGRLAELSMEYFAKKGITAKSMNEDTRKLVFESDCKKYEILLVRATDVPVYVEHGAADIGVVGKDILLEYMPNVYELKDLGFGYCRMSIAKPKDKEINFDFKDWGNLRVATKFTNIARKYFKENGINAEIIKLYGSIELAPILGLSDVIVDIVSTGNTLRENGLEEGITLFESTARIIANKISTKKNYEKIRMLTK